MGFDCHQNCPPDFKDQGLFCRKTEYGRGGGFPWTFKDGLNKRTRDNGMIRRCEARHGKGNCQKKGAMYYPKCRPGYNPFGCCICRPEKPNCKGLGMGGQIDLSCAKNIIIGKPHTASCPPGNQYDAGKCYQFCKENYYGVGSVC